MRAACWGGIARESPHLNVAVTHAAPRLVNK